MSTLIEELEQAADDCDILAGMVATMGHAAEVVGLSARAARLRARVKHVRRFMAVSALLNPDGKDFADKLAGPIPPSDETGGER